MKWLIVGFGWAGRLHADALESDGDKIEAVIDPYLTQKQVTPKLFKSLDDFFASTTSVDAAIISYYTTNHFSSAEKLFNQGIPCLIEKPVGNTYEETKKIIELAENKNVKYMAAFTTFFHPEFVAAEKAIKDGEIGKISSIREVLIEGGNFQQFKTHLKKESAYRGVVQTQGIHSLSRVSQFLGISGIVTFAKLSKEYFKDEADIETNALIHIKHSSVPYYIQLAYSDKQQLQYEINIEGEEINNTKREIIIQGSKKTLLIHENGISTLFEHSPLPQKFKKHSLGKELPMHFRGFREEQRYFRRYLNGEEKQLHPSKEIILDAHRLVEDVYKAQNLYKSL